MLLTVLMSCEVTLHTSTPPSSSYDRRLHVSSLVMDCPVLPLNNSEQGTLMGCRDSTNTSLLGTGHDFCIVSPSQPLKSALPDLTSNLQVQNKVLDYWKKGKIASFI